MLQFYSPRDDCLYAHIYPPSRRAQFFLPGHLLARAVAYRVRTAPTRQSPAASRFNFEFHTACGRRARPQRSRVHAVLFWADELRRTGFGDAGDTDGHLHARAELPIPAGGRVGPSGVREELQGLLRVDTP